MPPISEITRQKSADPMLTLDHIVIATLDLESTAAALEADWGALFSGGGQHLGFGTHNRVMRIDATADHASDGSSNSERLVYLELIAPDPSQAKVDQPRLFDLDNPAVLERLAEKPRLIHYVVRSTSIDNALLNVGYNPGEPTTMTRGTLSWTITLPEGGKPAANGTLPTLIEWPDMAKHPALSMPKSGVSMPFFSVAAPANVLTIIKSAALHIIPAQSNGYLMRAELLTPNGLRVINS